MFKPKDGMEEHLLEKDNDSAESSQKPQTAKAEKKDNRFLAIVAMNAFAVFVTCVSVFFKYANRYGVSPWEFQLYRSFIMLVLSVPMLLFNKVNPFRDTFGKFKVVVLRCVVGQALFMGFVYAITIIPLSLHIILWQTNPFWASLLGYFINKEPV